MISWAIPNAFFKHPTMANGKTKTARRREVRRHMPRPGPKWLRSPRRRQALWAAGYAIVLAIVGTLIALPTFEGRYRYQTGQTITEPVVSRVEFQAVDPQATSDARKKAADSVAPIYLPNQAYLTKVKDQFDGLMHFADYATVDQIPSDSRQQVQLTDAGLRELQQFKHGEGGQSMQQWEQLTTSFLRDLFNLAILENPPNHVRRIVLMHPNPGPRQKRELERNANVPLQRR